jgi:peptidyl-prolyl cis-trans isomerase C
MKPFVLTAALVQLIGAQTAPPGPMRSNPVVAVVDGKEVTAEDFRRMAETSPPSFAQSFQKDPVQAVEAYFLMRLAEEGKKLRLDEEGPLKEQLEMARMNVLAEAYFNHELNAYTPSAEEIDAKNQARYQQIRISGIKLSFQTDPATGAGSEALAEAARRAVLEAHGVGNRSEAEARELAANVAKRLRDGGDFRALVQEYSDDPESKAKAGDFGVVTGTSNYPEDWKRAVFSLKAGEVSDPIRQPGAFYVVRVEDKSAQPINEVRGAIFEDLRQAHIGGLLNSLRQRFRPEVKDPAFFTHPSGPVPLSASPVFPK